MSKNDLPEVAIIADAHFHDIESNYDFRGVVLNGKPRTLRSWRDTRSSSRVFNESGEALEAALSDACRRGINHVVLLGDYTDDGQIEATERLRALLIRYRETHDMAFYAIPGNHDVHASFGKHQSTRYTSKPGESVLVTSDPKVAAQESATSVLTNRMYRNGSPLGLMPMSEFGLFKQADYIHWESPFGLSDSTQSRMYEISAADGSISRTLMDASYLVEPLKNLWLLMLDANVYVPRQGQWKDYQKKAFHDSTDAGWNSVLIHKPHLLAWIEDVYTRASRQGKRVVAFSHYPIINPYDDPQELEHRLFGATANVRRKPREEVATQLLKAGMQLHFGGHLHINGFAQRTSYARTLTDIATPSPVAFPAGYNVLKCKSDNDSVETVLLSSMQINNSLVKFYRDEITANDELPDPALAVTHYGEFHYQRMYSRVRYHYLPKEWPKDVAKVVCTANTFDLANWLIHENNPELHQVHSRIQLERRLSRYAITADGLKACSVLTMVTDWYCLRQAGHIATGFIRAEKLKIYQFLTEECARRSNDATESSEAFMALFLCLLARTLKQAGKTAGNSGAISVNRHAAQQAQAYSHSG